MQVIALVHEENGFFGVSFPDFPGCTTVGNSLDEAMRKAPEALAFHIEGLTEDGVALPVPRTLTQITQDPEFGDVIADAMVAVVPYDPPARAVRINITVDESLLARIDRAAEATEETRSGWLAAAARTKLSATGSTEMLNDRIQADYEPASARGTKRPARRRPARKKAALRKQKRA